MIGSIIQDQVGVVRSPKDVQNKIESIERDFLAASDWLAQTGAGLESGEVTSYISKTWPLYYNMEPIMKDRASTKPILSHGTAIESNSSESDSDESDKECDMIIDKDSSISTPAAKQT